MRNLGDYFLRVWLYQYTLPKAIKEGYLRSPIMAPLTLPLKLDLSGVGVQAGGILRNGDIATALNPYSSYQIGGGDEATTSADRKTVVELLSRLLRPARSSGIS